MSEDAEDAAAERRFQAGIREVEQEQRREIRRGRERAIAAAGGAEAFIAALRDVLSAVDHYAIDTSPALVSARAILAKLDA